MNLNEWEDHVSKDCSFFCPSTSFSFHIVTEQRGHLRMSTTICPMMAVYNNYVKIMYYQKVYMYLDAACKCRLAW